MIYDTLLQLEYNHGVYNNMPGLGIWNEVEVPLGNK